MALTFLDLTNRVLQAFNEVQLTSATFATATGFHSDCKSAINMAILDIYNVEQGEWPFAWAEASFSTVAGTSTYVKHASATSIDWDSFYINSGVNISGEWLDWIDLDTYRKYYRDDDLNAPAGGLNKPQMVVRKQDGNIILTPVPNAVFTVKYEYFTIPAAMTLYNDTTAIPVQYEQVIVDKALHYANMFRDNLENAQLALARYMDNLTNMRRIEIPQPNTLRYL